MKNENRYEVCSYRGDVVIAYVATLRDAMKVADRNRRSHVNGCAVIDRSIDTFAVAAKIVYTTSAI